ncbi:pyridoxamine 5'-phosphate oxidase family protein [Oryzihumus leptocrescens]|uniref:Pyridoxamine 5'-phosphate oxidase n=1 Tax=Oryzihumus leptocrescens TaxID=297536 RepID=A0A542ZF50_9MICO|nr:pyridoxamine 5'-phosphate oxidase family protein [Oryzihumus leptocrescens]TQL58972.1 pyridoxamine 5'-phosphate oxidase [Oryzihumus leptocrescens]
MTQQGDLALLDDPVAKTLLSSTALARLAYQWLDGTPRVVPIWFHWNGTELVLGTPPRAPKVRALASHPRVAVTIDQPDWPYKVLLIRGDASVENLDHVSPEYEQAAMRYFGPEQGRAWVEPLRDAPSARIRIRPTWAGVLDFESRFPSALSA